MNADQLDTLLIRFRRQLGRILAIRVTVMLLLAAAIPWAWWMPEPAYRNSVLIVLTAILVTWVALALSSARLARSLQTGRALLGIGQLDDAEVWLGRAMTGLSLSPSPQLIACQQLASLFFRRDAHREVVAICQELLRHRLKRLRHVQVAARLMLADSLLILDRVNEAYEAMRPVYDAPLSLSERMKLLPIQLRYELAANHPASAVQALPEKVRIAELLDAPRAALAHALLAEACRRRAMSPQYDFLSERARLYWDLDQLVERYAVIAPVCNRAAPAPDNPSDG